MDKSDQDLIEEYIKGNESSLEIIIGRYSNHLYNFIYRLCGNRDEASDITQETFLKAWKNLKKYDSKQNFKTWIFTIARNTTIDWLRKKRPYLFSNLDNEESTGSFESNIADTLPLPDEIFHKKEIGALVQKALEVISPSHREIVLLHHVEEMTFEEIAKIVKKPMNTVKSQYRRALIVLRENLTKDN